MSRQIVIIAHDIRSTHNVGSLIRTAECFGVARLYLTGYTPYPLAPNDTRLPHLAHKIDRQIHKTALGAELTLPWHHNPDCLATIQQLRRDGFTLAALEQTPGSKQLPGYAPPSRIALLLGREVEGVAPELLAQCDLSLEIPQYGIKESLNVVQAAAIAVYHLRFA